MLKCLLFILFSCIAGSIHAQQIEERFQVFEDSVFYYHQHLRGYFLNFLKLAGGEELEKSLYNSRKVVHFLLNNAYSQRKKGTPLHCCFYYQGIALFRNTISIEDDYAVSGAVFYLDTHLAYHVIDYYSIDGIVLID